MLIIIKKILFFCSKFDLKFFHLKRNLINHKTADLCDTSKGMALSSDLKQRYSPQIHIEVTDIVIKNHQENVDGIWPL